jgi:hypothetical protein
MAESRAFGKRELTVGDAAVEGLLHGIVAGIGMACMLVLVGLPAEQGPAQVLARFDPSGAMPVTGTLLHLAVSSVYGLLFSLALRPFMARRTVPAPLALVAGLAYAAILLGISRGLMASAAVHLHEMPAPAWALGHLVYGLILGAMAVRSSRH